MYIVSKCIYIISMPIWDTSYSRNTEIVDSCLLLLTKNKFTQMYCYFLIAVSFYQGGDKADGYKRLSLISLTNVCFMSVYSTGTSATDSEDIK